MAKFVSFEDCVKKTLKKDVTNFNQFTKRSDKPEIKGYKFVGNRIYKTSNYQWTDSDWENYLVLMNHYKMRGHLDKHRCLIMAAWNQVKGRRPRPELLGGMVRLNV